MEYVLNKEKTPVPCDDIEEWVRYMKIADRRVAQDTINDASVSTVFLGINHQYRQDKPPLLFETMIFGGEHDGFCERYETWKEAEIGHALALSLVSGND